MEEHKNALIDLQMGAGKSRITIRALRQFGKRRVLIVCPQAVLGVWRGELNKHAPGEFDVVILDDKDSSRKKAKILDGYTRVRAGGLPLIVVVNYESMWRPPIFEELMRVVWDVMVCDELHRIKSAAAKAKASKACWKLGKRAIRRVGLTGTFLPHSPMDAFAQMRFLDDTIFGVYVTHFKNRYAIMNKYIDGKVDEWINQEEMQKKINLLRFHIDHNVLSLPPRQDIVVECPLSSKGMKAYKEMRTDFCVTLKQQVHGTDEEKLRTAMALNGGVKFIRLLQLAQGYVTDEEGEDFDTDTAKRRMLLELLEEAAEPVCVYGFFKHDMRVVEDCCKILGLRYGEISGRRKDLSPDGKFPENLDVLAVQVKSGSSGIDLTRARIGICLNTGTISPGDYDQVMARQYRPGQTRNVLFYHLVAPNTVDEKIQSARAEKRDIITALLAEFHDDTPF